MRGRPAKKVRKANLEAKTDESETSVPPLSPSKEFTFDADHGGRGKTTSFDYQDLIRAHRLEMIQSNTSVLRFLYQIASSTSVIHLGAMNQIFYILNRKFNVKLCILK